MRKKYFPKKNNPKYSQKSDNYGVNWRKIWRDYTEKDKCCSPSPKSKTKTMWSLYLRMHVHASLLLLSPP